MRRKEKEVTEAAAIEAIIKSSVVCRLGIIDGDKPYIVPMCFGYHDRNIYLHSSLKGKKIELIQKNKNVCFEFDINSETVKADSPCKWGMKYQSVTGFGKAVFIEDPVEKKKALSIIMNQYSHGSFHFPDTNLSGTAIIMIEIESMRGKQSGFRM